MKKRLGRGLEAFFPGGLDDILKADGEGEKGLMNTEIEIDNIKLNPYQPRKKIDENKLLEMAESIKEMGVVQPILVNKSKDGFVLVAGERRLRAAKKAGLKKIPAVVGSFNKQQMVEIALVENLQREDLNPLEEAAAFKQLLQEFSLTQEELAKRVGKSRSYIANSIRLLSLEPEIQAKIIAGNLTVGQIRPLLALRDAAERKSIADKISKENLTARDVEELVRKKQKKADVKKVTKSEDPFLAEIEEMFRKKLGTKVKIKLSGKEGKIELFFYGQEDLNRLVEIMLKDL
ncbi:MAG: ParB/RepB/Spo0J family partition protein [Firmicutes bacterium]|nr:ParB/RepB/Spo0J family partition protein [Bacillota bacterium]